MRTPALSALLACLALGRVAWAQSAGSPPVQPAAPERTPHAVQPAAPVEQQPAPPPPAQPTPPTGGPQPTPDVPVQQEPSPPTPLEPAPAAPVPGPIQSPDATAPTPAAMLGVNVPHDRPPPVADDRDAWQAGHALGVNVVVRGGSRVGAPSFSADTQEKAGLGFGLGAAFRLTPEFSFGFGLSRMSLGAAASTSGQSTVNANYATTELELGARAYPFRWNEAELFVGLHAGLAWQDVDASGLRPSVNLEPAQAFRCSDTSGPGFALGAELGGALRLARDFWFVGDVGADGYRLTSDPIGTCAVGIGSITALSVGAGLLYAFDLGREAKLAAASASGQNVYTK